MGRVIKEVNKVIAYGHEYKVEAQTLFIIVIMDTRRKSLSLTCNSLTIHVWWFICSANKSGEIEWIIFCWTVAIINQG